VKLWGGRFESGPSEVFERFSGSLDFDRRLIDSDIRGSQAFARALERVGILSADERAGIVEAFEAIRAESADPRFYDGATDEDVHTLVIRKLKEKAGAVADKIHTGRSRNEQVSVDTRLWLREECDRVRGLLLAGHVGRHRQRGPAVRPDRRCQVIQPVPASRHQGDGRSLGGQPPRGGGTDPAARPGDQGDRVLQLTRHGTIIAAPGSSPHD